MNDALSESTFKVNEVDSQFELQFEGGMAYLEYIIKDDKIYLTHTKVPKALEGQGLGGALVKKTLEHLLDKALTVMPLCSFVAHYIDNHPAFQSLLSDGYQM